MKFYLYCESTLDLDVIQGNVIFIAMEKEVIATKIWEKGSLIYGDRKGK